MKARCLNLFSIAMIKDHDPNVLNEERVYFCS